MTCDVCDDERLAVTIHGAFQSNSQQLWHDAWLASTIPSMQRLFLHSCHHDEDIVEKGGCVTHTVTGVRGMRAGRRE